MPLSPGTLLGPYEIVAPLGAGGMGEVYRARDARLGRDVAVKVLPQHLSDNPDIRTRFEREARTISSLNHPNICTLFDVGREGETDYLVMELIEGDTLADRLRKGPLPAPDLVRFGVQIADALDRAHRAGVVHRDLKPGNIMLTRSGAKLMDFGLARATGLSGPSGSGATIAGLTHSPTQPHALTAEGTIVGTFQYMSPEQLEGRDADARSDIWALGCVLYEMATGRRAFEGRSQASLIAAIMGLQPPALGEGPSGAPAPGGPPPGLERLVRNCLTKDPEERIQTAHDVKLQLQGIGDLAGYSGLSTASSSAMPVVGPATGSARAGRGAKVAWLVAGLAIVAGTAFAAWAWPRLHAAPAAFRFNPETDLPGTGSSFWPRVSPDGRQLVFQATDTVGVGRAYLLRLDETRANPIPGTERLQRAYWSPDSREIAFVADNKIQRVSVTGGSPAIVCPAPGGADLSWGAKGMILLDGSNTDSIRVVPAGGGELHPATRIYREDHEVGSGWPSFLPDGEHFLFTGTRSDAPYGNIRLGRIGSLDSKLIGRSDGRVEYAPGGWVLYVSGSSLIAQKLDLGAGKLVGQRITLVDDLRMGTSAGHFSVSRGGVFAFQRSGSVQALELHLADRTGAVPGPRLVTGTLGNPRLSPDGRRVLYERFGGSGAAWGDVSVYDLERGTDTKLTFTDGQAVCAQWSPDGRRFAYTRVASGQRPQLVLGSSDGLGDQDSIAIPDGNMYLSQWAEAGAQLVGYNDRGFPLAVAAEGADRKPAPMLGNAGMFSQARVSPDGRWIAGVLGVNPDIQVYVQSLSGPAGRWQISSASGRRPIWTKGGRELIFESFDGRIMAVDIDTREGFHAGTPRALFQLPLGSFSREVSSWTCDADGERFVLVTAERTRTVGRTVEVMTDFQSLVNRK